MINNLEHYQEKNQIKISKKELPLSCPIKNTTPWDSHPRIYLEIKENKKATCPYCYKKYILID